MISIVTHVPLKEGTEREWDTVMLARMNAAKKQPGWVGGQLLRSPNGRVIIGTWQSRADWERWHHSREFRKTRRQLDGMTDGPTDPGWHEVVAEVRKGRSKGRPQSQSRDHECRAVSMASAPLDRHRTDGRRRHGPKLA